MVSNKTAPEQSGVLIFRIVSIRRTWRRNDLLIHKSVKFTVSGSSPIVQLSVILFVLTEFLDLHL
ncbi:hypothetical protein PPYC2_27095 [Paenibacillus polymyxa]|nr:hypothetical protein PPYC2_27095 [Paenibacillus polymyxa]POR25514.1 hypothetical protein CG775_21560 [Paenibacillus polymyxa]